MTPSPAEAEVRRIAAIADGATRNLRITDSYFRLSAEFHARLAGASNWCTFAAWASRQAGQTIRHQDLVDALRDRLRASRVFDGLARSLVRIVEFAQIDLLELVIEQVSGLGPLQRTAAAVARGNQKVYEEIGFEFARFLARFPEPAAIGEAGLEEFLASLRDGEPPDGQALLKQAFRNYRSAARAPSAKEKAEWVLLANLRIGLHEQTRLQPEIRQALDGAAFEPADLVDVLLHALGVRERRGRKILARVFPFLFETPLRKLVKLVAAEARAVVRVLVTEHMMTLALNRDVVRLGEDLTRPFPADLRTVANPELRRLLDQVDPTPDTARGTAARDWADLRDRMHFIADLFRAYHEGAGLIEAP